MQYQPGRRFSIDTAGISISIAKGVNGSCMRVLVAAFFPTAAKNGRPGDYQPESRFTYSVIITSIIFLLSVPQRLSDDNAPVRRGPAKSTYLRMHNISGSIRHGLKPGGTHRNNSPPCRLMERKHADDELAVHPDPWLTRPDFSPYLISCRYGSDCRLGVMTNKGTTQYPREIKGLK